MSSSTFPSQDANSFTLIELMAACTVLSIVLLMMVGMQDQMSRAWSNANRRTDTAREARAATMLLADDLSFPIFRSPKSTSSKDNISDSTTNKELPFLYSRDGSSLGLTISNLQIQSSCIFFITCPRPRGTNSSDLALVGYYVASSSKVNVSGFTNESYNLHRYYSNGPGVVSNLASWFANKEPTSLFRNVSPANDDILAQNVANFKLLFYNNTSNPITNGINYTNSDSGNPYAGNKIQVSLTLYPGDVVQKFKSTDEWTSTNSLGKFARSYEFRLDSPRQ